MGDWKEKATVVAAAGNRCSSCGMDNWAHYLLTGRSLHVHRPTKGAPYDSKTNGVCLCYWCHHKAHGNKPKRFPRKLHKRQRWEELLIPYLHVEEIERLDQLGSQLNMRRKEVLATALALLQIEVEKTEKST